MVRLTFKLFVIVVDSKNFFSTKKFLLAKNKKKKKQPNADYMEIQPFPAITIYHSVLSKDIKLVKSRINNRKDFKRYVYVKCGNIYSEKSHSQQSNEYPEQAILLFVITYKPIIYKHSPFSFL